MARKNSLWITLSIAFLLSACAPSTPAATSTLEPTATPEPTATGKPAGVTLTYGDSAQVELVTPAGRHVYIDVWNTPLLSKQPGADDVLLTTHLHSDHYFSAFVESFPGQKIIMAAGKIGLPDVTITAIISAHLPADPLEVEKATNFLFVIETGGLRIVHFGDCGQLAFTADQMAEIGAVDLAITQFSNSFSMMDAVNRTGFNQMDQVKPRLIIPTHYDRATLEIAAGLWAGFYARTRTIMLSRDALPEKTSLLLMGAEYTISAYAQLYNFPEWK
jgi:L-ascorbate metabolism protein UlaG (beta-lactamase superfamily)